jgi:hypothetical protein
MANTNGFLRYGTLREVFGAWARTDLAGAAAAALTLPGGTSQQAAAEMLTEPLVKNDRLRRARGRRNSHLALEGPAR